MTYIPVVKDHTNKICIFILLSNEVYKSISDIPDVPDSTTLNSK